MFGLYLEMERSRLINGTFPIKPYVFYVPPNNEVGLSSHGESQFHIFVNTTGTTFSFGMIAAELTGMKQGRKGRQLFTHSTFSFLPDNAQETVRLKKAFETKTENHFDVILRLPALHRYGGILSLLSACPTSNSVITRMDMKQTLHLHPQTKPVIPLNFLHFANVNIPTRINLDKFGNALIRCKAIGNPLPSLELIRVNDSGSNSGNDRSVQVPTYTTMFPFEIIKTFQFVNANASHHGTYICKAKSGERTLLKKHILSKV